MEFVDISFISDEFKEGYKALLQERFYENKLQRIKMIQGATPITYNYQLIIALQAIVLLPTLSPFA
jgi:hypothetical protein